MHVVSDAMMQHSSSPGPATYHYHTTIIVVQENDLIVDTLALEATKEYAEKMGRWRKRALATVQSSEFWACASAMHLARGPLIHFSSWVKQLIPAAEVDNPQYFKVVALLSKCTEIMHELFNILHVGVTSERISHHSSMVDKAIYADLVFIGTARHASQFHRRVVHDTLKFPLRIFVLIRQRPKTFCQERRLVSSELLKLYESNMLDVATSKILANVHFRSQIEHASVHGTIGDGLYAFLASIAKHMKIDVRESERVNKLLTMLGDHCPNSTLVS